jgi:uncharacterized membrane protein SirB2
MYLVLKHLHQAAVAVSLTLFVLRGVWMWRDSPALEARWVKVVPHVVDTLLLASAIGLAWTLQQYPFVHAWLTTKLLALVLYIVLGSLALKPGRPKRLRLLCFLAALAVFGYIVSVARSHDPRGLFALLAGG